MIHRDSRIAQCGFGHLSVMSLVATDIRGAHVVGADLTILLRVIGPAPRLVAKDVCPSAGGC